MHRMCDTNGRKSCFIVAFSTQAQDLSLGRNGSSERSLVYLHLKPANDLLAESEAQILSDAAIMYSCNDKSRMQTKREAKTAS